VEESTVGKIKLFIHKDKILGGTMIAKNAGELIQELILAKVSNIPLKKIICKNLSLSRCKPHKQKNTLYALLKKTNSIY